MNPDRNDIAEWFKGLQDAICKGLEELDGKARFKEDRWERQGGGGGITRVIQDGNIFEKGGVNFSAVFGKTPSSWSEVSTAQPQTRNSKPETPSQKPQTFFATGLSIVLHPANPFIPIIHMNVRYIEMTSGETTDNWFGGGIDLTPIYIDKAQAAGFHRELKNTCDKFDANYYPEFKKWADDYFFIPHRHETRGVGGIFFDRLKTTNAWEFVKTVGLTFLPAYTPVVKMNRNKQFTDEQKQWQLIRRGRYAEFNLVYDRGTKFGLETGGRTESILMSLPPLASWKYHFTPAPGSHEEQTQQLLKKDVEW